MRVPAPQHGAGHAAAQPAPTQPRGGCSRARASPAQFGVRAQLQLSSQGTRQPGRTPLGALGCPAGRRRLLCSPVCRTAYPDRFCSWDVPGLSPARLAAPAGSCLFCGGSPLHPSSTLASSPWARACVSVLLPERPVPCCARSRALRPSQQPFRQPLSPASSPRTSQPTLPAAPEPPTLLLGTEPFAPGTALLLRSLGKQHPDAPPRDVAPCPLPGTGPWVVGRNPGPGLCRGFVITPMPSLHPATS